MGRKTAYLAPRRLASAGGGRAVLRRRRWRGWLGVAGGCCAGAAAAAASALGAAPTSPPVPAVAPAFFSKAALVRVAAAGESGGAPATTAASAWPMLPALVAGGQIGAGWRVVTLPQQKAPVTRYSAETVGGRQALRIEARASYGNLVFEPAQAAGAVPGRISWAWRVQQRNDASDITQRPGDDLAVKVCMSFDLPLARVPFMERQMLRLARSRSGENLPAATLCWVWGGSAITAQVADNPYSRRVRYIVLRTQSDALDTWFEESRDVAADFRRAFGDEAATPPPLVAVVVAGDADNTGEHSIAHVAALRWQN